jgi:DNA-binding winged helix-turn-helix (wHTH) protein/tetratricopeptide (TPR) repeat protein
MRWRIQEAARRGPRRVHLPAARRLCDPPGVIYAFGSYALDEESFELRREGEAVKLEPKVFDVLRHLVANRERVVTKTELLDALWPGEHVTESAVPRAVAAARRALADDRTRQSLIRTVHGRGYQFVAPVATRGARGVAPEARRPDLRDATASVFVGREGALERLEAALAEAASGRGRMVLLFGEPGIGKTRTAEVLCERARARGFDVVQGRCPEVEGAPAFWPWAQVLRALTEEIPEGDLAADLGRSADAIAHLVPELVERLEPGPAALPSGGDEARFRLFDGVSSYLHRRAAQRPLVILIDDLHWADEATSLLLRFLAREGVESALLVIASYREVELRRGGPLTEVLAEISREPHAERIPLRGLDRAAVARFLEAAGAAPDAALVDAVSEITQGNPFFLWETVRLLRAEGTLAQAASRSAWDASLPQGLRDVVGRRLDRLSEPCNRLLSLASVIGPEFGTNVLQRFAGQAADPLLELLHEAVRARVIAESPEAPGRYAFGHALIRQTLYEEIPTPVRVRLHRELGEVLERVHGAGDAYVGELAHQFYQAAPGGDVDKAIDYAARAGSVAHRLLAYEEAAAWFGRALQALDLRAPDDPGRRCELILDLGDALASAGDRRRSRSTFRDAAERARALGRADLLARAALGFAGRTERGSPDSDMRVLLEEALETLGEQRPELRARLLSYLVGTPPYNDSVETRLELSRQAVELARESGDSEALLWALAARCWAMPGPDHLAPRLELALELMAMAEKERSIEFRLASLESQFRSRLLLGDVDEVDRLVTVYDSLAQELRQPQYLFLASMNRVARALSSARFEEARQEIEAGFALGRRIQHPAANPLYWGQRFWLYRERGDAEQLAVSAEPMVRAGREWISDSVLRAADGMRLWTAYVQGRSDEARVLYEKLAHADFLDIPRDEHWFILIAQATEMASCFGDVPRLERLAALLRPVSHLNVVHDLLRTDLGSASHFLGVCERELGDAGAAVAHFEAALVMNERLRAPAHLARTRVELADALLRRRGRGDAARAAALLEQARATARDLGIPPLAARAEGLRARLR